MRKPAAAVFTLIVLSPMAVADGLGDPLGPGPTPPPGVYQYPPPIIRLYTWNGLYMGGHAGAGWTNSFASNDTEFLGGAQIGFNVRAGRAVLGLEAQWTGIGGNGQGNDLITLPGGVTGTFESEIDWTATLTARLGFAWDRSMVYVRGGPAWARSSFQGSFDGVGFDRSETRSGWAIGGGYEYAFRNAWSARLEYMFMDFGSETVSFDTPAGRVALPGVDHQVNAVTLSINYRFDWPTASPLGPD
jgi:outer membrane immunogenic protein